MHLARLQTAGRAVESMPLPMTCTFHTLTYIGSAESTVLAREATRNY
jgi:hypothetical protein